MRLAVSVEGQTEEEFVKAVLHEHLRPLGVAPEPVLIGGSVTVRRLASDMALLYHSHDSVCVNSSRLRRTSTTITKRLRAGASQV